MSVKAWTEKVIIPTYGVGTPDKNPMFFEKRVYQGSSGVVYPNPIIEKIYDEKIDKEYLGVFLENKYLKIMILPELGGRVQMAYDKIKERHFIYYNQVIKPALVGLCGPWISGGIEFNWPQHHRPSTYEPIEFIIEEKEDGSKTIWVNEVEKMFHTKGMAGFTLYPDKAFLEIEAKLNNRNCTPQTFLWWANPAVKVHDNYQSIFPPDVHAVFDHGKRDVSDFPIATGTYYKVDYSPGTDISKYKNIPVPTSYMAVNSKYNFLGGYEHDIKAGMLHVADHHISPGKKQWTWGNGDFGMAWDRNLTDEDGPYIELMAGVYTDNQPDFTWLKPFEEKSFTQYFLPYRELEGVKNASKDLLINAVIYRNKIKIELFATWSQKLRLNILKNENIIWTKAVNVDPLNIFKEEIDFDRALNIKKIKILILDQHNKEVLSYDASDDQGDNDLPSAAEPALLPHEIDNNEQLFLTGQHLEQYRHATYRPMPYYLEAIRRDPHDIRNNNAIGLWYFRKGLFAESEPYFKTAIETITRHNPNPYDCEPYYNLGLSLFYQDKLDEAYKSFFKAAWDKSFQDIAYFYIALIDFSRGHFELCLEHIDWAIDLNARNGKAYIIKVNVLQKLNFPNKAQEVINLALAKDMFNINAQFENCLLQDETVEREKRQNLLLKIVGNNSQNIIEYAIDYIMLGEYEKAIELITTLSNQNILEDPLINYYLAYAYLKSSKTIQANSHMCKAADVDPSFCFPNRLEDVLVLKSAIHHNPKDGKAHYYLGNLFYDKQQYDIAISLWEKAIILDPDFATGYRNLGLAYYNKKQDSEKALMFYEKAFSLNNSDSRVLMELDALYKKLNKSPEFRLNFLDKYGDISKQRDDLYLEIISIYNILGNYEKSYELLINHKFHPWEGGEGKVSEQYVISLVEMAKRHLFNSNFTQAIKLLEKAQVYPDNLGEGKLSGAQENDIFFWLGYAYREMSNHEDALRYLNRATMGSEELGIAQFYNDQKSEMIFYQGLAWLKLGNKIRADKIFNNLISHGNQHIQDDIKIDYFAVSLPDLLIFEGSLNESNIIHCLYITALGYLGLGEHEKAQSLFEQIIARETTHIGARIHLNLLLEFIYKNTDILL